MAFTRVNRSFPGVGALRKTLANLQLSVQDSLEFKFTGFYLYTGLPGDRNRLQGVESGYRQDGSPHTLPDRDCVAILTVNPWVSSVPAYYSPCIIIALFIMYAKGKRGHVTSRSLKSRKNVKITVTQREHTLSLIEDALLLASRA